MSFPSPLSLLPLHSADTLRLYLEGARALSAQLLLEGAPPPLPSLSPPASPASPAAAFALVTGAAAGGIGHAVACALAEKGWHVIATALPGEQSRRLARDFAGRQGDTATAATTTTTTASTAARGKGAADKGGSAAAENDTDTDDAAAWRRRVTVLPLDLRLQDSVAALARSVEAILARSRPPAVAEAAHLALVVHCAGVMLCPPQRMRLEPHAAGAAADAAADRGAAAASADEHAVVNVLMPLRLTLALLPCLRRCAQAGQRSGGRFPPPPTVLMVSSCVHRITPLDLPFLRGERGLSPARAYAQSKLGQLLAARWLAAKVPEVRFAAAHPGVANTHLYRHAPWLVRLGQALGGPALLRTASKAADAVLGAVAVVQAVPTHSGDYFEDGIPTPPAPHARSDPLPRDFMAWAHGVLGMDEAAWEQRGQ